jgi:hypothetical protein
MYIKFIKHYQYASFELHYMQMPEKQINAQPGHSAKLERSNKNQRREVGNVEQKRTGRQA